MMPKKGLMARDMALTSLFPQLFTSSGSFASLASSPTFPPHPFYYISLTVAHLRVIALAVSSTCNAVSPHPDSLMAHLLTSSPLLFQCHLFREALPHYLIPNCSCISSCPPCVSGEPDSTYLNLTRMYLVISLSVVHSPASPA